MPWPPCMRHAATGTAGAGNTSLTPWRGPAHALSQSLPKRPDTNDKANLAERKTSRVPIPKLSPAPAGSAHATVGAGCGSGAEPSEAASEGGGSSSAPPFRKVALALLEHAQRGLDGGAEEGAMSELAEPLDSEMGTAAFCPAGVRYHSKCSKI